MRPWVSIQFLTFVLLSSLALRGVAAPDTDVPPDELKSATTAEESTGSLPKESVGVTPSKGGLVYPADRILATRIVRDRTWDLALGLWSGPLKEHKPVETATVLSAGMTFSSHDEDALEYSLDLTGNGLFGLRGEYKKYCCLGEHNEPYWTVGAAGLYDPADLLAGFVTIESYQVQAGGGLEDLFQLKRRLRVEGLVGQSLRGTSLIVRIGYAFDDSFLSF